MTLKGIYELLVRLGATEAFIKASGIVEAARKTALQLWLDQVPGATEGEDAKTLRYQLRHLDEHAQWDLEHHHDPQYERPEFGLKTKGLTADIPPPRSYSSFRSERERLADRTRRGR